ncbi:MAG: glycoside hydrolase family 13 protein [Actinobacteria bacterium]|nr:glycoside hydrolase family 13 protein [Actinomycetota bacterium]
MIVKFKIPDWVRNSIFYQIFIDRFYNGNKNNDPIRTDRWGSKPTRKNFFGGDLEGIVKKLPYLKNLGINAIYLTPIFKASTNHKYDTEDYFSIDPSFGDIDTFKKLLKIAHNKDIKIIIDGVFNHTGDNFWAFKDIIKNKKSSPYIDWYFINDFPIIKKPKPNYATFYDCYYLPKLNVDNTEVKKYIFNIVKFWTKMGIDGWRLDTVPFIKNHNFWKEFRILVKEVNPNAYLVGEIWENARPWLLGDEFDGSMNYRLRDLVIKFFIKKEIDAKEFNNRINFLLKNYPWEAALSMLNLLGSHDTERYLTLCQGNLEKFRLSLIFLFTFPGAPMIYYGDEVGMVGENDPDCRRTMVWDKSLWNKEINDIYRKLIRFRMEHESLRSGSFKTLLVFNRLYVYQRLKGSDAVIVVLNAGEKQEKVTAPLKNSAIFYESWVDLFTKSKYKAVGDYLVIKNVPKLSALVLKPDNTESKNCVA